MENSTGPTQVDKDLIYIAKYKLIKVEVDQKNCMADNLKDEYQDPAFTCGLSDNMQWILAGFVVCLLAIIVPIASIKNQQTSELKAVTIATGNIDPLSVNSAFEGIVIMANVTNVDSMNLTCTIRYLFFPMGSWQDQKHTQEPIFSKAVRFITEKNNIVISTSEFAPSAEIVHSIQGLPIKYPFETYSSRFTISFYNEETIKSNPKTIPLAFGLVAGKQSWSGLGKITELDGGHLGVDIRFDRGWMTKIYAIGVSCTMWIVTISVIVITWTIYYNKGKAESGLLRLALRFLFAFPAMRRNQPGIVVMGCTEDVSAFFWCMLLMSICAFTLISNVAHNTIYETIPPEKQMYPQLNKE
jgi:hypothetical protein